MPDAMWSRIGQLSIQQQDMIVLCGEDWCGKRAGGK